MEMFLGTINAAHVHPREIVKECLWRGAAAVVLAHSHPSDFTGPSDADLWFSMADHSLLRQTASAQSSGSLRRVAEAINQLFDPP